MQYNYTGVSHKPYSRSGCLVIRRTEIKRKPDNTIIYCNLNRLKFHKDLFPLEFLFGRPKPKKIRYRL